MSTNQILTCLYGSVIDFADLKDSNINMRDIAHRLSNIRRFNGGTVIPYTVGQHTLAITELISLHHPSNVRAFIYALLHDAAEAFIGDMVSPLKVTQHDFKSVEEQLLDIIYEELDLVPLKPSEEDIKIVKEMDFAMSYAEWYVLNGEYVYDRAGAWKAEYGDAPPDLVCTTMVYEQVNHDEDHVRNKLLRIMQEVYRKYHNWGPKNGKKDNQAEQEVQSARTDTTV